MENPGCHHLWKILDIFHTMGKLLDHEPWVGNLNKDHGQVIRSWTTGRSLENKTFVKSPRSFS
jgi:hypothetical protein